MCQDPLPASRTALGSWEPRLAPTARFFLCAHCRAQALICRRCDRGQRYCTRTCAHQARRLRQRAAARRYQATRAGRFRHAARARRYRLSRKNVTHQGSSDLLGRALLAPDATVCVRCAPRRPVWGRCCVCQGPCAGLVRRVLPVSMQEMVFCPCLSGKHARNGFLSLLTFAAYFNR